MNVVLWVLQVLLALHTTVGGVWKFFNNAEQTMHYLKPIPDAMWKGMGVMDLILAACLIIPAFYKPAGICPPVAAICIILEMLLYCGLLLRSGDKNYGPMIYWLIVIALCGFLAYGRFVLSPLK